MKKMTIIKIVVALAVIGSIAAFIIKSQLAAAPLLGQPQAKETNK